MLQILFFSLAVGWSLSPAPRETVSCYASAYRRPEVARDLPLRPFHPQKLELLPEQTTTQAAWPLLSIELDPKQAPLHSEWALGPLDNLTPTESRHLRMTVDLGRPPVEVKLSRFGAHQDRVAGLSIELFIPGGYFAAYLHRPELDGPVFSVQSPLRDLGPSKAVLGWVQLDCRLFPSSSKDDLNRDEKISTRSSF